MKYSRRKFRTIDGKRYDLDPPSEKTSDAMSKIPSSRTKIEKIFASALRKHKIKTNSNDCLAKVKEVLNI